MDIVNLEQILESLRNLKGHRRVICVETGLDYDWMSKLVQGRIDDPGIKKIQILSDWMNKNSDLVESLH